MAMTSSYVVRPIEEGDGPQILLLASTLSAWFTPRGLADMARDLEAHGGFVAVRGGRVLGFLLWAPGGHEVARLTWMGVDPGHRRRGIGRALLEVLVAHLRRAGYRVLEVDTVADTVPYEPYAETRRFYRAMGFVDHRVDRGYYGEGDDRYDRLVMRKPLEP